jgi:rRNA maturation endonuclease Nob1
MKIYGRRGTARYGTIEGQPIKHVITCPVCGTEQANKRHKCLKCGANLAKLESKRKRSRFKNAIEE